MKITTIIEGIAIILTTGLIIGLFVGFIFWIDATTTQHNLERINAIEEKNFCKKQNAKEILQFVKDCTNSLKVEENAYVVESCEQVAVRNLCP